MTKKQTTTLLLFAQNFSLPIIAKKQRVSLTTIRQRIKSLSKNHSKEFGNAFGIRESYKRARDTIRNPVSLDRFLLVKKNKDTTKHNTNCGRDIDDIQKLF